VKRLALFAAVGATGFAVDAGLLAMLLASGGLGPLPARILSIAAAMLVTFLLNRALTFGPSGRPVAVEGARYAGVALAVAACNWLIYAGLVLSGLAPLVALTIASALAMVLSWLGYRHLVFAPPG